MSENLSLCENSSTVALNNATPLALLAFHFQLPLTVATNLMEYLRVWIEWIADHILLPMKRKLERAKKWWIPITFLLWIGPNGFLHLIVVIVVQLFIRR